MSSDHRTEDSFPVMMFPSVRTWSLGHSKSTRARGKRRPVALMGLPKNSLARFVLSPCHGLGELLLTSQASTREEVAARVSPRTTSTASYFLAAGISLPV